MATLQSGKCFTVPTFFGMCCRSEWQERMYIYKWHEVDQTKHEIFCVHIVCNEIQVKVNLEITTFFFYLRFPYCPNFFWFGVVLNSQWKWICLHLCCLLLCGVSLDFTNTTASPPWTREPHSPSLGLNISLQKKRKSLFYMNHFAVIFTTYVVQFDIFTVHSEHF